MRLIAFLILLIWFNQAQSQINDSIYSAPLRTEKIDTIRYDSSNTIRFIEYAAENVVIKRLFYSKNDFLQAAEAYDNAGRSIWSIGWYPNGKIRRLFYNNNRIGQAWYEDGTLELISTYSNDTCVVTSYYKNGAVSRLEKGVNCLPFYIVYYCENGQIIREDFVGKEHLCRIYYCDGRKKAECKKDASGIFVGKYTEWNKTGKVAVKGQYASAKRTTSVTGQNWGGIGQREGKWKYYDENGKLIKTEVYKNGVLQK